MNYRADIDGLRAIAVLSVVIFHLGVPGMAGGYVGVDVFFVISGYLITSIIRGKLTTDRFQLSDFYLRRIRRLIPPLLATIAATTVAAAFILSPFDLVSYSRSAVAAVFSLSNFVFFFESGYWDTASELKPLLHTWSLGVEEQFYLFWPALLIVLHRWGHRISFATALVFLTIASACLCIGYSYINPSAAFYLFPFRVFQFSAGALVIFIAPWLARQAFLPPRLTGTLLVGAGLASILLSIFTFNAETLFPGWAVLLPTLGSVAVLLGGCLPIGGLASRVLENRVSLWLGRVSYSLYLVHWPIVALYRYQTGAHLNPPEQVLLLLAILFATVILHYGVERRFYRRGATSHKQPATPLMSRQGIAPILLAAVCLAAVNATAWLGDGWLWRFPTMTLTAQQIEAGMKKRFTHTKTACRIRHPATHHRCNWEAGTQVLVLGNSVEVDGYNFLHAALGDAADANLILFEGMKTCRITEAGKRLQGSTERCQQQLDALFDHPHLARMDTIFYAANKPYDSNKQSFLQLLTALRAHMPEVTIVTLGGFVKTERPCAFYINKTGNTDSCMRPEHIRYFADNPASQPLYEAFSAIETLYIDRVAMLCKHRQVQTCTSQTDEGIPALYDTVHLSLEFAQMIGRDFARQHPQSLALLR